MNKMFPYLEASGSYKDIGRSIGGTFKNKIQALIRKRKKTIPNYDKYLLETKPYFEKTVSAFPHLIEELAATAKAAEVSLEDLFFINNREVFDVLPLTGHCTIAVSFGSDGAIVGHNEDWSIEEIDDLYILKATIGETSFLGLQYFETLGVSATMNSWGLVQCVNDLSEPSQVGVPKNFIARAILECKTLDQAEDLIRKTPCASGFNHVLVQGDEVRNIEVCGNNIGVQKLIKKPYVHTNHFLTPEMIGLPQLNISSSMARYARASQLVRENMTKDEMIALLSDKQNQQFPICREKATIGSVICIPKAREVWICYGHPCVGSYNRYQL